MTSNEKKSIVITGGSDGIGKALAWEMAARGYNIGLIARRKSVLEVLKHDIEAAYPEVKVAIQALDVTQYKRIEPAMNRLAKALGQIDILMVNAGIAKSGRLGESPLEDHLEVIDTNVNGALATIDAGLKIFRRQGYGHLLGTSSVAAYRGLPRNSAYCASKAALTTILEAVRAETLKENIQVTVLSPGYIDTAINRALPIRPFVISVEKGARSVANMIEKKVSRSTVPVIPWSVLAPALKFLPTGVIARI